MELLGTIKEFLKKTKDDLKVKEIFLIESSNGYVLSSTREDDSFDVEALGSLSSGSITALELLFEHFSSSTLLNQLIETNEEKFMFHKVQGNYFIFICTDKETKSGYLKLKTERIVPDLQAFIDKFNEANNIDISGIDIDEITRKLDDQFDSLFTKDA